MSHTTEASAAKPILWCLIFVGAWLAVSGLASFLVQWKASKWPTVEGSIRRAEVVPENDYYFVRLEYEFTVDGVAYTSDDVYLNSGIGGISVAWTYLKLAAAFAPREIELDWNQRRLTIRDSRGEQSYSFQEIRRLNLLEARRPSAKQKDSLFRLEAQLPGRSVILLEADEADEIVGLAETEMPSQQRVRLLAEELAPHLGVAIDLAEPVTDRFNAVGYPGEAHLTDMVRLWRMVDGRTKRRISLAVAAILLFWIFRIVRSYQANADVG